MRYEPRQPAEGINVSKTHPLAEAGILAAGTGALFVLATLLMLFLVDIMLGFISTETETRWFKNWTPNDVVEAQSMSAAEQDADALLQRLAQHWPETDYEFRLRISDSSQPNALAFPGGLIIVTRGLMERVTSENELAFVLGHELGHYRNRDHIRQLGRATVFGIFYAAITQTGGGTFGFGITDLTLRGFNREQESDADEFGLTLLQREYGHVNEATRFFERIASERNSIGELASYFETHPQPGERMRELRDYARDQGWSTEGELTPWPKQTQESISNDPSN